MLSRIATYWLAGIGVVGVASVTPVILKYYHVWPGAADAPAPLLSPSATNTTPTPPPPAAAATAAPAAAPTPAPAPVQAAAEPTRSETPSAQPVAPASAAPTAVASSKPIASEQPTAAPSAPAAATTPTPAATPAPTPPASPPTEASAPTPQSKPDPQRPAFDVVRVEPTGDAVIAGRASPRAAVQLRSDGRVVAQVDADETGQFAFLPPPFPAGGHRLQLAARSGGASEVLSDAIGIEVPGAAEAAAPSSAPVSEPSAPSPAPAKPAVAPPPKPVETARSQPSAPPKAAPPPEAPKAPPPAPAKVAALGAAPASPAPSQPVVSILSVEASGTGRLEVRGAAEPNTVMRLYLNNAYLAQAIAGADGRWSLTVERGMTPGAYAIRADEIDRANGAVVARAEVPFNYPDRPAGAQVAAAERKRALEPPPEKAPAKPVQDQATPSATTAPAQAARPAPQVASAAAPPVATAATPAPQPAPAPQAAPAPEPVKPIVRNEAPQTPAPPAVAAPAPERPKAQGTEAPAKNLSAPAQNAATIEPAPSPPSTSASAAESPAVAAAEPAQAGDDANPVIPDIRTTKVVRGDNLWDLSRHFYGDGPHYKVIYEANASQIRNPRLIYPDQIFVVPRNPPQ